MFIHGARLKFWRNQRRLSRMALADKVYDDAGSISRGAKEQRINRIEFSNLDHPDEFAMRLASALSVPVEDLQGEIEVSPVKDLISEVKEYWEGAKLANMAGDRQLLILNLRKAADRLEANKE